MSIKRILTLACCLLVAGFYGFHPSKGTAKTIEVEEEDEEIPAQPLPTRPASPSPKASRSGNPSSQAAPAGGSAVLPGVSIPERKRVRIDDQVGFYYFVKAGYAVSGDSEVPCVGKVIEPGDVDLNYSTPVRLYLELKPDQAAARPGDLFVVYRTEPRLRESHSGFEADQVQNLAIVQVLKVSGNRCLVEAKQTFAPFRPGDKVQAYGSELKRWKKAHVKKTLPDHPVRCYVAAGEVGRNRMQKTDFILLTAGTRQGVVEGQTFELDEVKETGFLQDPIRDPQGSARVIFAGPDCSTAQILSNHESIQKGFEAVYQP